MAESGVSGLSRKERKLLKQADWWERKWGNKGKQPTVEDEEENQSTSAQEGDTDMDGGDELPDNI